MTQPAEIPDDDPAWLEWKRVHDESGETDWRREPPDKCGDWLWVTVWSCGCCVMQCGIAWVQPLEENDEQPYDWQYGHWKVSFVPNQPVMRDGNPHITAWRHIQLPPFEWADYDFHETMEVRS